MSDIAVIARLRSSTGLPRDDIVNVFHFGGLGVAESFDDYTQPLGQAYLDHLAPRLGGVNQVTTTAYDLADAMPRPPQNVRVLALPGIPASGPREVAVCLSYFADRNLPRNRGRVYLGPWSGGATGQDRPGTPVTDIDAFATAVHAIPSDVADWCVYSVRDHTMKPITDIWIDNEWDTQRRRGMRATVRNARHL